MPASYIVIEGAEGAGKTTIARMLVDKLTELEVSAKFVHEPDGDYDTTTAAIRQITQDPSFPMNSRTEVLLYNAARSQSLQGVKQAVAEGTVCIADRSYLSTLAVQFYGRGDIQDYRRLNDIIDFAVQGVWPDVTIVLDAPVDALMRRAVERGESERFDTLSGEMLERIRAGYLWEANQRDMSVVYATGSVEETFDEVWRRVAVALELQGTATSSPVALADVLAKSPAAQVIKQKEPSAASAMTTPENSYHVPDTLPDDVQCDYCDEIERILGARKRLASKLAKELAKANKSLKVASLMEQSLHMLEPLLPVACRADVLSDYIAQVEHIAMPAEANRLLPAGFSSGTDSTQLTSIHPRNELDLLPNMLYPSLDIGLAALSEAVDSWSYDLKARLFESYITDHPTGKALKDARYQWDCMADMQTVVSLPENILASIRLQPLTPRYGYAMPDEVETAGLADEYDAIFDMSLQLQSSLQSRGFALESQYATLLGHRQRFTVGLDAAQLLSSSGLPTNRLLGSFVEDITEHHTIIGTHLLTAASNREKR